MLDFYALYPIIYPKGVECMEKSEYTKRWKEKNPEAARESHRKAQLKWRAANREKVRETVRKWTKNNRDKVNGYRRKQHFKVSYSLTIEQRNAILTSQGNVCACCGSPEPNHKQGWVVDHCHTTGKVRGVLCQPCNLSLGKVRESIPHLKALISYLEKHHGNDLV